MDLVNREGFPGNVCYGCGHDNPHGLHVEISRDPGGGESLVGSFLPPEHLVGFPGVTHGGALYTALDCMAAWTPTVLRAGQRAIWILRSATMTYARPARPGRAIALRARIAEESAPGQPIVVHASAHDEQDRLVAEGRFKVVPLAPERFLAVAGIDALPENWRRLIGVADEAGATPPAP